MASKGKLGWPRFYFAWMGKHWKIKVGRFSLFRAHGELILGWRNEGDKPVVIKRTLVDDG